MIKNGASLSLLTLVAANLIPLFGVLFYGWDEVLVLALFWIENLIIGFFNLAKILAVVFVGKRFGDVFLAVFFLFHYGMFCTVHGLVLWDILNLGDKNRAQYFSSNDFGLLDVFLDGMVVLFNFLDRYEHLIWLGIATLFASHLVRFIENFVLSGDVFEHTANSLMTRPYTQIIIMHAGLILGAILIEKLGSTVLLLALIVAFKLAVDVVQFLRRREKREKQIPKQFKRP